MKKRVSTLLYICLLAGLAACNLPVNADPAESSEDVALQYLTVSAMLTATAGWEPGASPVPTVLPVSLQTATTAQVVEMPEPTPESTITIPTRIAGEALLKVENAPCDQAQAGIPIDITVPDETQFSPGEYFSKTWRLVNGGNCIWTHDYSVFWFSGDDLGVTRYQPLSTSIEPGQVVDITIDMVAPKQPGMYQSNWKLQSADGNMFGIGPNSDSPFWVRIVVVPTNTPTLTPTIPISTPTRAPVVLAQGAVDLQLEERLELDMGSGSQEDPGDLIFRRSEEGDLLLALANGARLASFGLNAPRFEECLAAELQEEAEILDLDVLQTYFCYRTSEGQPGRLLISRVDFENYQLGLEFITWAVP